MKPKKTFYKIALHCTDGKQLPITIATADMGNIPELIERNRTFYKAKGNDFTHFVLTDTKYPLGMTEEQYLTELEYCDIVDEDRSEGFIILDSTKLV